MSDCQIRLDVCANEGESAVLYASFYDAQDPQQPIDKAALLVVRLTLTDSRGQVINGRLNDPILDQNGGTVDMAGRLTLILSPDDNALSQEETTDTHRISLTWAWRSAAGADMTGKQEILYTVRREPVITVSTTVPGWPG